MKSILLHINDDDGLEARIQSALDLARAFDGHITCLQTVTYEIFAPGDFYGSAMAAALPVIRENAEALRKQIEDDLANEDVSWEWVFKYGMAENHLLLHGSIAKLTDPIEFFEKLNERNTKIAIAIVNDVISRRCHHRHN